MKNSDTCPQCGSQLTPVIQTKSGKYLRRCSAGSWNPDTKSVDGCDYVLWVTPDPEELDEKCPKCGSPLLLVVTRFGKRMKRCSTNKWDPTTKTASGCDYVEFIGTTTEELDEGCPDCGEKLVLKTTANGKRMKVCSTHTWDPTTKTAGGCEYIQWQAA